MIPTTTEETRFRAAQLVIFHGRNTPEEDMEDWGFDGPTLPGVKALKATYDQRYLIFIDNQAADQAADVTGWRKFGSDRLVMEFHEDLLVVDGKYYGDWEVQVTNPRDRASLYAEAF